MRELPISIHALVKRATILYITVNKNATNFNPRPRKEGDMFGYVFCYVLDISIHALAKRATPGKTAIIIDHVDFNPRPRKEGDVLPKHSNTTGDGISIHALVKRATSKRQGLPMHL